MEGRKSPITLIAAIHKSGEPSFLISDIAVSGGNKFIPKDNLPLKGLEGQGYFQGPPVENEKLTQACQKMYFWGAHSLQWAGSVIVAYSFHKFVLEKIDDENWPKLINLALEEFGEDLQDLAFIYHHSSDDEAQVIHYNCSVHNYGETMIICAGSGVYRFTEEFDINFDGVIIESNFQQMAMRLNHLYAKELHDPNAYFHAIGLAYEVGILKGKGWKKAPYTLAVFSHNEASFGLKTTFSVFYGSETLFVFSSRFQNKKNWHMENWVYLPNEFEWIQGGDSMSAYLRPFQNCPKVIESDFGDLTSTYFVEGVVPVFNLTIVERHSADDQEPETNQFGYLGHIPAVCGVVLTKSGASKIASRALYRREVEEIYLNQKFVPPPGKEGFYESQQKLRTMAVPFEFTSEDL